MEAMSLDNVVGSMLLLKVDNWRDLEPFGIEGEHVYARCVGVGDFGIWIENPAFESAPVTAGAPESSTAYILIAWSYVKAVVYFPNMDETDLQVVDEVKKLGFK